MIMRNKEMKQRYIIENEYTNLMLSTVMNVVFTNITYMEDMLEKDCCNFTVDEIITYYKMMCTASLETLMVLNSNLSKYTTWAIANGFSKDNQNHYAELDTKTLNTCINLGKFNDMIITRDELLKESQLMPNVSDQFLVLALFEGVCGKQYKELINLKVDQFNGNNLHLEDRTITVSDKLVELAEESASTYDYYGYASDGSFVEKKYKASDDCVLKQMYNATNTTNVAKRRCVYNKLARIKDFCGREVYSTSGLLESGRLSYIRELAVRYGNDYEKTVRVEIENISHRYGNIYSIPRYLIKYAEYLGGM